MAGEITFRVDVRVEIFPDRMQKLFDTPTGPVGLATNRAAKAVLDAAKPRIGPRGFSGTTGKPKEARKASLRDSGSVQHITGANWKVIFDHPIAFIHHQGSKAHMIPEGGKPNKTIKGVQRVFLYNEKLPWGPRYSAVSHPGTKANPFLTDAAKQVGLRPSGALRRGTAQVPLFRGGQFF